MNFHKKALLIGAITVLLCVGVVLWVFVIDKGTLTIAGDSDFSMEISGGKLKVPEKKSCISDPCLVRLPSGSYEILLTKSGYFDETRSATVKRQGATTISIDFEYVPTLEFSGEYDEFTDLLAAPDVNDNFSFAMDTTYKKQRLTYTDSETGEETVWAYFDNELSDPAVYVSPSMEYALVLDKGAEEQSLYLIDGVEFARSYLGSLSEIQELEWSLDDKWALIRTENEEGVLWLVNTVEATFAELPLEFSLEKMVWGVENQLFFATNENLADLEEKIEESDSMDILESLFTGGYNDMLDFSIGVFDVEEGDVSLLYEVPLDLEFVYEEISLFYDKESDQLLFTDGARVYEVVQEFREK
ncbi:hypothetical protein HN748_03795 [Candidatus Peregrinibacteria bacterium]|jgi:hypothetical protein|nr:hypothetical protein [Candidatus Peregrinibacteria bacterium]MBT7484070.1 hypothetical protein [Candidatus Peregrinibacteria bacterium]MBT7703332.1 hypothetical protein [Candidatus Peregrinibacteria bacterium]